MEINQFVNELCKDDSKLILSLKEIFTGALKKKDVAILNAKYTDTLTVYISDMRMTQGDLILEMETSNPPSGEVGVVTSVFKKKIPATLAVKLPKVMLTLVSRMEEVEFLVTYKHRFIFTRNILCSFKVRDSLKNRINGVNLEYNTGFSGSVLEESQKLDIYSYGKREGLRIDPLYTELINEGLSKDLDLETQFYISDLNTICLKLDGKEFHITHTAIISRDNKDYQVLYDSKDGEITKNTTKKYLETTYDGKTSAIIVDILNYLK